MIKIGILGDIGSGKSHIAKNFGYPVFNADIEVGKLYKTDKKIFNKLKKVLPKYIYSFPVNKGEISNAILSNKSNLKKIVKIVHLEIRKKLNIFLKKNINKRVVILDIPLLLENKINKKNDIYDMFSRTRSSSAGCSQLTALTAHSSARRLAVSPGLCVLSALRVQSPLLPCVHRAVSAGQRRVSRVPAGGTVEQLRAQ